MTKEKGKCMETYGQDYKPKVTLYKPNAKQTVITRYELNTHSFKFH